MHKQKIQLTESIICDVESNVYKLEWNGRRILSKANYLIQTNAIQRHIIPQSNFSKQTEWIAYAEEADLLNVALFGCTAKQWREANPSFALDIPFPTANAKKSGAATIKVFLFICLPPI